MGSENILNAKQKGAFYFLARGNCWLAIGKEESWIAHGGNRV